MAPDSLERVTTAQQTLLGSALLPLEIQQQVFAYLDAASFYAARKTCKWWWYASLDAITLDRQLRRLPIRQLVEPHDSSDLWKWYGQASHTLMLGLRIRQQGLKDACTSHSLTAQMPSAFSPQITSTKTRDRTVTLYDGTITLFDSTSALPAVLMQRRLNDLKETLGSGPWLKVASMSTYRLALSSDASLLAVAQERTVQIYDLTAAEDSFTINQYVSSASGHYIAGLAFEQNDRVLRVHLSGDGAVLYLGAPDPAAKDLAGIGHWKSKAGLRHTFLDSSVLPLRRSPDAAAYPLRVSSLQLLRPFEQGFLFAAQRHGGNESSHYILGHVACSVPNEQGVLTAESGRVTEMARLESFLSAWRSRVDGLHDSGMGLWENMPSAHEHQAHFALSSDHAILALAEQDKKQIRPLPLTQLFFYRLPTSNQLSAMLACKSDWHKNEGLAMSMVRVDRLPLCLGTLPGTVLGMRFEASVRTRDASSSSAFTIVTTEATRSWTLVEF